MDYFYSFSLYSSSNDLFEDNNDDFYFWESDVFLYFPFWKDRKLFLQLMENFVEGKIDGLEFDRKFCQLCRLQFDEDNRNCIWEAFVEKVGDEIVTREMMNEFKDFSDIISGVWTKCNFFEFDSFLRQEDELNEDELRESVKHALLEINKRYP